MKLCFPIESEDGLNSRIYSHFGSAPNFIIYDTETDTTNTINNQNLGHEQVLTTFTSYGQIEEFKQGEIISNLNNCDSEISTEKMRHSVHSDFQTM